MRKKKEKSEFNYLVRLTVRKTKLKVEVERTKEKFSAKTARYLLSTFFVGDLLEGRGAVVESVVSKDNLESFLADLQKAFLELKERLEKWRLEIKTDGR